MATLDDIKKYNGELKEGLAEMFNSLNKGQQKKILKNPKVKALLIKFHIIEEEQS